MIKILFVCHGNICRSPMAEFVMKDIVNKAGMKDCFAIASAATSREEIGRDVHPQTKRTLTQHNIPFHKRGAVQMTKEDYDKYDYIIGMDGANIRNILRIVGADPQNKVKRLLDYRDACRDIADPWYTGDFALTYHDVVEGTNALFAYLNHHSKKVLV